MEKPFITVAQFIEYLQKQDPNAVVFCNDNPIDPDLSFTVDNTVVYKDGYTQKTLFQVIQPEETEQEVIETICDNAEDPSQIELWGNQNVLVLYS